MSVQVLLVNLVGIEINCSREKTEVYCPIYILPDISRNKDNQTMIFGYLIEYNMRNIFLEKSYTKCGGETIPRPFSKISLD